MWWNWEARGALPVTGEATRARGRGRRGTQAFAKGIRRAPQQEDTLDLGSVTTGNVLTSHHQGEYANEQI